MRGSNLDINTVSIQDEGNLKVHNEVYHYEEYISSEGLQLDYSVDGHKYRLFNRRQNGIDIIEFGSRSEDNRQVKIVERLQLDGRTQYFRRQKHPSEMIDCLSSRDDGSCLYMIDLNKPHKPYEYVIEDKIIKAYDTYDDYDKLFCMSNHDSVFFYDTRTKARSVLSTVTNAMESKFNLIYNVFRDGRMINAVTISNVLVFDIRNPGESVLKFKHFCDVPPNRHVFAKSIDEESQRDMIDDLVAGNNLFDFEDKVSVLLSDNIEMKDKSLKNSMCLYSCRNNSFPVFLTSYEPLDKQEVENKFSYDIIKEINQTLDPNRLFSQLTRSEIHPQRLFSSNIIDNEQKTNGVSLVYHKEKVYFLHLDNNDHLSMQVIQKKDKEKGYAFRKFIKDPSLTYDEHKFKALVKFEEFPRLVLRKTSVTDLGGKNILEEDEESVRVKETGSGQMDEESLQGKEEASLEAKQKENQKADFDSDSLELEPIVSQKNHKELLDIRKTIGSILEKKHEYKFKSSEDRSNYSEILSYAESLDREKPHPESQNNTRHPEKPRIFAREDLENCQRISNERYFITKHLYNTLMDKF